LEELRINVSANLANTGLEGKGEGRACGSSEGGGSPWTFVSVKMEYQEVKTYKPRKG